MIELTIVSAKHTGGTKFYQMFQFRSTKGGTQVGFGISNYGPVATFIGHGRATVGQISSFETYADSSKRLTEKLRGGYDVDLLETRLLFKTKAELEDFSRNNFGRKAKEALQKLYALSGMDKTFDVAPELEVTFPDLEDEPIENKPAAWGTW